MQVKYLTLMGKMSCSTTVVQRVTHLPSNTQDVGSNPGTARYIVGRMTT